MREIVPGEGPQLPRPAKEDVKAAPKGTMEGEGYLIECWTCRLVGKVAKYGGENSRSPY